MSIESRPLPLAPADRAYRVRARRAHAGRVAQDVSPESSLLRNGFVLTAVSAWAAFVYAAYVFGLR